MNRRNFAGLVCLALVILASVLVINGCQDQARAVRERIAINANADSYVRNGYDILLYSDDRSTQKMQLEGSDGDLDMEGDLDVAKTTTLAGQVTSASAFWQNNNMGVTGTLAAQTGVITGTASVGGQLVVTGASFLDGAAYATGPISATTYANVGTFGRFAVQATHNVTTSQAITPTGTYQPLDILNNGNVNSLVMSVVGYTAGDTCMLTNVDASFTIGISDTGTTMLTGDVTLGQYDTLLLLFDGTNWLELSRSNN